MTRDIAVLVNPHAGRGRHRDVLSGALHRLGAGGHRVRVLHAGSGPEAEQVCHRAVRDGVAALVAAGGDGTVHRAVQAVAGPGVGFAVLAVGTGNDFAAGTGVPRDPVAAADAVVAALNGGGGRPVDLGRVTAADGTTRWFGAVLAAGFDALVNERANRLRWPRGPRRYDVAAALELVRLRARPYAMVLDGVSHEFPGVLVAVGNCPSYGGGMRICPDADPGDGLLDVVTGGALTRAAVALLKPRLRRGTHVHDPRVASFRARQVRLDAPGIVAYADGERLGPLPVEISCVPGALRLLC